MSDLSRIFARRAALLRELADLDVELGRVLEDRSRATPREPDAVLSLEEAALHMGEPVGTFRRRGDYLKARVSRAGERRLRYSRAVLDRIKADRLAENEVAH